MSDGAVDLLYAGRWEPAELADFERRGLRVARATTVVGALARLRLGPAGVVLTAGEEVAGREEQTFAALRAAGGRAVVAVYPPPLSHHAAAAVGLGADAAVALPAPPGRLREALDAALGTGSAGTSVAADHEIDAGSGAPDARPAGVAGDRAARRAPPPPTPLESLFADAALMHRTAGDMERVLDQVLAAFSRRSGAERCSLLLLDPLEHTLTPRRAMRLPRGAARQPTSIGTGLAGLVARTERPLLVPDVRRLAPGEAPGFVPREGYRTHSCLLLPLVAADGLVAVVCLTDKASGEPFDTGDLRTLVFLADHAAQALENALRLSQLRELAVVDELTGLYNRRYFQGALEREVVRARRYQRQLTLAVFDLDQFKKYNDTCGHPAGDRALTRLGKILRSSLREVDVVARYGGEEFAVILPETSARPAPGVHNPFPFLERLRKRVERAVFEGEEHLDGGQLTLSGGLACFPDDAQTVEDLLSCADRALYVSKSRGRNCITHGDATLER